MLQSIRNVVSCVVGTISRKQKPVAKVLRAVHGSVCNLVFDNIKQTAIVMIIFNAAAIFASHNSQINGLAKSTRDNKEFLIEQEKKERKLDLWLTLVPPLVLNYIVSGKLSRGKVQTKHTLDSIKRIKSIGVSDSDLYNVLNFKQSLKKTWISLLRAFADINKSLPNKIVKDTNRLDKRIEKLELELREPASLEKVISKVDDKIHKRELSPSNESEITGKFYNCSAYDDICGQNEGILNLIAAGYSILASNIIMPILKNKWTNEEYYRNLKAKGHTVESMLRKSRFEYTAHTPVTEKSASIFKSVSKYEDMNAMMDLKVKKEEWEAQNSTFASFNKYNKLYYKPSGLKV